MNDSHRRLPDSELEVMQALWACEIPASRKEIEQHLDHEHPIAVTTLLTLLTRLAEKKYIHIEKNGRSSSYSPLVTKQDYLANQSRRFIRKLCDGNISALANALCNSGLKKEELDELRDLLNRGDL